MTTQTPSAMQSPSDTEHSANCRWCGAEAVELVNGQWAVTCSCRERRDTCIRLLDGDITPRMQAADWGKVPPVLARAINQAVKTYPEDMKVGRGLWISGGVGTGKTMALGLAGRALITRHLDEVRYVNVVDLFARMKTRIDQAHEVFEPYLVCDVLLLDDLGKEQITDWKRELLYYLVDRRYTNLRPLWVATNLGGAELVARCGEAVADRILEVSTAVKIGTPSMRGAHA